MIRSLVFLLAFSISCFASGSSQSLVAEMNGWTLTLTSSGRAEIEKRAGDRTFSARIPERKFNTFWDYFYLAKTLPETPGNQKSPFRIVVEDIVGDDQHPEQRVTVTYLAAESARPIFELMLLTFRSEFAPENEFVSVKEAKLVEEELNKNPPIDRRLILPKNTYLFKVSGGKPEPETEPWLRESDAAEEAEPSDGDKPSD